MIIKAQTQNYHHTQLDLKGVLINLDRGGTLNPKREFLWDYLLLDGVVDKIVAISPYSGKEGGNLKTSRPE